MSETLSSEQIRQVAEEANSVELPEPSDPEKYPDSHYQKGFDQHRSFFKRSGNPNAIQTLSKYADIKRWIGDPRSQINTPASFRGQTAVLFSNRIGTRLRERYEQNREKDVNLT